MQQNPFQNLNLFQDRGAVSYLHNGNESISGAFLLEERAEIKLLIPRSLGTRSIILNFYNESGKDLILSLDAKWFGLLSYYDIYKVSLPIAKLGVGLYFYEIKLEVYHKYLYAANRYGQIYFSDDSHLNDFQISVSDFKYNKPKKHYGGVIYQIFVDRFFRKKTPEIKEGAVFIDNWSSKIPEYPEYPGAPIKNNYFYGGTLDGISDKLDYIKSLGVTSIYLNPIFEARSNHKYDTGDYMKVDAAFGGDISLKKLITKAKRYGIDIILDGVFNHTGDDSIYFNKYGSYDSVGAFQSKDSNYYSWYEFESYPNKYTCWWGIDILPRINPDKESCREFFVGKNGVIDKYSKMGVGGFRLDVADELSDDFISKIKERLNENNNDSILYGEVWEDASNKIAYGKRKKYYLGTELDGVMNYPLRQGIINYIRYKDCELLEYALKEVLFNAPKRIRDAQMNLLGTHDTERIITVLGGEDVRNKTNSQIADIKMTCEEYLIGKQRLISAYTLLATLPGIPTIFYGDEAGVEGYSDPFNRSTFPWGKEDKEILNHYRMIGKIRQENSVYREGDFRLLYLSKELLIFARYLNNDAYLTIINNKKDSIRITFSHSALSLFDMSRDKSFEINGECSLIVKAKKNACLIL